MTPDRSEHEDSDDSSLQYESLLHLEELESLLEDLEEAGVRGMIQLDDLSGDLRERVRSLDVNDIDSLRATIAELHRRMDRDDAG